MQEKRRLLRPCPPPFPAPQRRRGRGGQRVRPGTAAGGALLIAQNTLHFVFFCQILQIVIRVERLPGCALDELGGGLDAAEAVQMLAQIGAHVAEAAGAERAVEVHHAAQARLELGGEGRADRVGREIADQAAGPVAVGGGRPRCPCGPPRRAARGSARSRPRADPSRRASRRSAVFRAHSG